MVRNAVAATRPWSAERLARARPRPGRIPLSTYRLQFRRGFGFREATRIVPYLHALGITDVYASPLLAARAGSSHGYDVTDPTRLNPELGTAAEFEVLADVLASRGMGLLLDIVPNHMAADASNLWWWDVLEHGRSSAYAEFFDIDWDAGDGRIVLPVLGASLDEVIAKCELKVALGERGLELRYHDRRFPLSPGTYGVVLGAAAGAIGAALGDDAAAPLRRCAELSDGELRDQPQRATKIKACFGEWQKDERVGSTLLAAWLEGRAEEGGIDLRALAVRQAYRLEFWKDGLRRIDYRRFFDVSDLISVRAERPEVFEATHRAVLGLIRDGSVSGLRVDHVDGLHDPQEYLERLSSAAAQAAAGGDGDPGAAVYIVAEKILARGESLPVEWPVAGTTGYEFAAAVSRVFVDSAGYAALEAHAARSTGIERHDDGVYAAKREVLKKLFPAEVGALTERLTVLASELNSPIDRSRLREALEAVTAGMSVYRTYLRDREPREEDRARIAAAAAEARTRGGDAAAIAFVEEVLRLDPARVGTREARREALAIAMRWQQLSGPTMAKGVEDTALYRRIVLTSLDEVGSEPRLEGDADPVAGFHAFNARSAAERPWTLNATSTHDTKRSEDVRARISVLSELSEQWTSAVDRLMAESRGLKEIVNGEPAPAPRDEALLYQTLLGAWPLRRDEPGSFLGRIEEYLVKAAREAKVSTSWMEPNAAYESALKLFARRVLDPARGGRVLAEFAVFERLVAFHGMLNSLSQALLKFASPGAADTYQGAELWDLSLVDPDNRRAVDFESRVRLLEGFAGGEKGPAFFKSLRDGWEDGRIKLWVTTAALHARRERPGVFLDGSYQRLEVTGERRSHVVAFARRGEGGWAVAVVPRLSVGVCAPPEFPLAERAWEDTAVALPAGAPGVWHDAFTGDEVAAEGGWLRMAAALRHLPVGLLAAE